MFSSLRQQNANVTHVTFVHSFGHAKHRLLPSQIPYYSYARNLVSLDHVNSTFSQLVVFRQCRLKVLGHLARYYWNNLPPPPPPQAMLRFDTTTQISTKILFICIFQHCLGGRGVVRSNCDPKKPTLLGIHDYWTGVPTTFDLHCRSICFLPTVGQFVFYLGQVDST